MKALHEDEVKIKYKAVKDKYETEISRVYNNNQNISVLKMKIRNEWNKRKPDWIANKKDVCVELSDKK